ncbi:MAG: DMT family transporter [Pseudonocardiales bacterium]|nr:DMT family transporter [Pseudonocardiales bacterium]
MRGGYGGIGLVFALLSAATFAMSGPLASALIEAGWSPAAAVTARIGTAALVLTIPAVLVLRHARGALRHAAGPVLLYGTVAVAGCQLAFFNAVAHLSVGVALLLEYLGSVLVVGWLWLRHGQRPRRLTVAGAGAAVLGLLLVLDVTGSGDLDVVGVLWGLAAAVGLATFFIVSASTDNKLPAIPMAWASMLIGSGLLIVLGAAGLVPLQANTSDVLLLDHATSWLVALAGLAVISAVIAYVTGIGAARRLGAKVASFVGLTEVLFAVLFAWLMLGQLPRPIQLVGGVFIVAGVAMVRLDELRTPQRPEPVLAA